MARRAGSARTGDEEFYGQPTADILVHGRQEVDGPAGVVDQEQDFSAVKITRGRS